MELLVQGLTNKEIERKLSLADSTVKNAQAVAFYLAQRPELFTWKGFII